MAMPLAISRVIHSNQAAQPLEQRHIRHRSQAARTGAYRGLAQRTAIGNVNQQHAQHRAHTAKAAQPPHRSELGRLGLPLRGQHLRHNIPVLANAGQLTGRRLADIDAFGVLDPQRFVHGRPFLVAVRSIAV